MLSEGFEEEAPGPLKPRSLPLPVKELPLNVSEEAALHWSLCRLSFGSAAFVNATLGTGVPLRLQHAGPAWFCCSADLLKVGLCRWSACILQQRPNCFLGCSSLMFLFLWEEGFCTIAHRKGSERAIREDEVPKEALKSLWRAFLTFY